MDESLSAPGRNDATSNVAANLRRNGNDLVDTVEPVLYADVAHVLAHEEEDDEGGHDDIDESNEDTDEEEAENTVVDDSQLQDMTGIDIDPF